MTFLKLKKNQFKMHLILKKLKKNRNAKLKKIKSNVSTR